MNYSRIIIVIIVIKELKNNVTFNVIINYQKV
jgi:hypothetical protein